LKTLRADLSILTVAALTGLAALGCSSTRACNPDTLFVTVTFNDATKNADTLQVNVNIDGGTTKTTMLTHKPGDTSGSVEVYFPTGYPKGKMVSVTIVALDGQATVGSATAMSDALPDGCATLSIKFGGSSGTAGSGGGGGRGGAGGSNAGAGGRGGAGGSVGGGSGGGGSGGSTAGTGGGSGGSAAGAGGSGGSGGSTAGTGGGTPLCTENTTRSCALDGFMGNCARGVETCTGGKWGACSILAATADSCATKGDDANCDGTANGGCTCVVGDAARSCAMDGAKGNCAAGTETCLNTGKWSACSVLPASADSCAVTGDDANCNGIKNDGCPCVTGNTQACGPDAVGICKPGVATCTNGVWGACVGAVNKSTRDCTSTADNDCDGRPDNTIDTICQCGSGFTQTCNAHPGYDGKGPCKAGSQSCVVASDRMSSAWGACSGAVGPAGGDTCAQGNDDNCTGTPNDGCICINNVTVKACGLCGDGSMTCTDGKNGAYGPCNGAVGQAFTPLSLTNGWANYGGTSAPAIGIDCSGMVMFKGAMATIGTDGGAFTIPVGYRPPLTAYLGLDQYFAHKGRMYVPPSGVVAISAESTFSNAAMFTSLDGTSYALSATGYTPLTLINGWTNYSTGTRSPAISNVGGIVRMQGSISAPAGSALAPFTLPVGYRPPTEVYIPIDLFFAAKGRLRISSSGAVTIEPFGGTAANATSFTSLEGVSFALNTNGYTAVTLSNGWTNAPFATRNVMVTVANGIVRFQGAMGAPDGSPSTTFTLPSAYRPPATVWLRTSMCGATEGRIYIDSTGVANVQAETAATDATCFTSLEGVWFAQ